jgi:adenine-specific DNA-methyltransferase
MPAKCGEDTLRESPQINTDEPRSALDLFYTTLLDLGLPLTINHIQEEIGGVCVFRTIPHQADNTAVTEENKQQTFFDMIIPDKVHPCKDENFATLVACFDDRLPESLFSKIAKRHPDYVVFKESAFNDIDKKAVEKIFRENAPNIIVKVID